MDLLNIGRIGELNGNTLNVEEVSGLEAAMMQRKLEENLPGKMHFWGKVFGSTQDYLVVFNIDPYAVFPEKKYYFCTTNEYVLKALPPLSQEYKDTAESLTMALTGDASFFKFNPDGEYEDDDPEQPPVERFRELHRLSHTVRKIDHDCALVPRGAYVVDAGKKVIPSANYQGLSFHSASETRAYQHFRPPESLQGIALLKKPGIVKSGDFLDCIDQDTPAGMWVVTHNSAGTVAFVRNLYWEGYGFYSVLGSAEYGGAYFGNGVPHHDIAFML